MTFTSLLVPKAHLANSPTSRMRRIAAVYDAANIPR